MPIVDIAFMGIVIPLALIFMLVAFHYKGIVWMPFIPAVLWAIVGLFCITRPASFTYQGYLSLLFFALAVAMLFAPYYLGAKHMDIDDQDEVTPRQKYMIRQRERRAKWSEIRKLRKGASDEED